MKSLLGIFIGDCCGSPYEGLLKKGSKTEFSRIGSYTDDTEQAYGIALWLKSKDHSDKNLEKLLKQVFTGHDRGYGSNQARFLEGRPHRKDSYGNGSAMRVAPVGDYAKNADEVIKLAKLQSSLTHQHPEAINGAVTIALLAYLVKHKKEPMQIKALYPQALMPEPKKEYLCSLEARESVPPAVEAFLSANSFEEVLYNALSYGGDTDTIAAMACGIAALKFAIPKSLLEKVVKAHKENQAMYRKIRF